MIKFGDIIDTKQISALFLIRSEETEDNCISFVIAFPQRESVPQESIENEKIGAILADATALCPGEEQYRILFENYILYQVRNESYASWDDTEMAEGTFLLIYEKSRLLDALPLLTDCQILKDGTPYPGKWKHYSICCLNHIIDVISCKEPTICKLESDCTTC